MRAESHRTSHPHDPLQRGGRAGRGRQHEPHPRPLLRGGRAGRGRQHEPHPRPLQRGGRAGREQQHEPHPRPLLRSGRTRSRHSCSSRRPQGAVQRRHERYHRHAGDARQGSRRCFFRVSPAPVPTAHTTLARESWLQLRIPRAKQARTQTATRRPVPARAGGRPAQALA